ncbi:MAG: ATP-binding protein [Gallionella sp.]|nr:ATP-binding protein [Gallionella sp.]
MNIFPAYLSAPSALITVSVCQEILDSEGVVEINAGQLRYVDPFGMAMLGACFNSVRNKGCAIVVRQLSANLSGYLQRMDVFHGVELVDCAHNTGARRDRSGELVELTQIANQADVGDAAYRLAKAMIGREDTNEKPDEMSGYTPYERLVEPLQYALNELLENALTHARRGNKYACVWVASQYYPKKDLIRLGVVDNGCGFLESLQSHSELLQKRHLQAILLALRPRISCNRDLGLFTDSVNQGVGLTTSCRIAEHAGGRMILASGNAMHSTTGYSGEKADAYWQGVGIAMEVSRTKLADVRVRELLPSLDNIPPVNLRFE